MIKHIVVWTLKDEALGASKAENLVRVKQEIEALRETVPGIHYLEVGCDIGAVEGSCDIAIYSEFETREALDAYQAHPEHEKVKALLAEVRDLRAAIDYEI